MKTLAEIQTKLAESREWVDENENSGASEVGVELGWLQALEWVLS
jgi:hypothetical protein